ncbi:MAG: hypothetical protein ABSH52_23025 [Terriglobia bacterium]|jgi:hypothetical protein
MEVHPDLASEAEEIARSRLHEVQYEDIEAEALEICKGLVLGCYRLSERAGGDVLGWAPDFPGEPAGHALEVWYTGTDDRKSREARRKQRPPLPPDFLALVPKWIPMIERVGKERK